MGTPTTTIPTPTITSTLFFSPAAEREKLNARIERWKRYDDRIASLFVDVFSLPFRAIFALPVLSLFVALASPFLARDLAVWALGMAMLPIILLCEGFKYLINLRSKPSTAVPCVEESRPAYIQQEEQKAFDHLLGGVKTCKEIMVNVAPPVIKDISKPLANFFGGLLAVPFVILTNIICGLILHYSQKKLKALDNEYENQKITPRIPSYSSL